MTTNMDWAWESNNAKAKENAITQMDDVADRLFKFQDDIFNNWGKNDNTLVMSEISKIMNLAYDVQAIREFTKKWWKTGEEEVGEEEK